MADLKPCPFCGGVAKYESSLSIEPLHDENGAYIGVFHQCYFERVYCTECGAEISSDSDNEEAEITIKKWNRRAAMKIYRAMKDPPCKDCGERSATCHGTCEAYKAFRQYRDEYNKTKAAASEAVAYFRESASKQAQKARRRKR